MASTSPYSHPYLSIIYNLHDLQFFPDDNNYIFKFVEQLNACVVLLKLLKV